MKVIFSYIPLLAFSAGIYAQTDINSVLNEIEQNNTTINAYSKRKDAIKAGNRDNIALPDPDIDFAYHWKNNSELSNVKEISIKQSFDYSTISGKKKNVAESKDLIAETEFQQKRNEILLEAKKTIINIIFLNKKEEVLDLFIRNAEQNAFFYEKKLNAGEGNIIDLNKAKINLAKLSAEKMLLSSDKETLIASLKRLNNNISIKTDDIEYNNDTIPANFTAWYDEYSKKIPAIKLGVAKQELAKQTMQLAKSCNIPAFFAGYKAEWGGDADVHSLLVGTKIPLWNNRNNLKENKLNLIASNSELDDIKTQMEQAYKIKFDNATARKNIHVKLIQNVSGLNIIHLLKKALDAGQISLFEYIKNTEDLYSLQAEMLYAEFLYHISLSKLYDCEF